MKLGFNVIDRAYVDTTIKSSTIIITMKVLNNTLYFFASSIIEASKEKPQYFGAFYRIEKDETSIEEMNAQITKFGSHLVQTFN